MNKKKKKSKEGKKREKGKDKIMRKERKVMKI